MNTITLDTIAKSAKVVKNPHIKLLPIEIATNRKLAAISNIPKELEDFKIINNEYQSISYKDKKTGHVLPKFATVSVNGDGIQSENWSDRGNNHSRKYGDFLLECAQKANIPAKSPMLTILFAIIIPIVLIELVVNIRSFNSYFLLSGFGIILPSFFIGCYLEDNRKINKTTIKFQFQGEIPEKTREIYRKHEDKFDDVVLICDAENQWAINTEKVPAPRPDPLLCGVKSLNGEHVFFLLDQFDLTFNEQYMLDEFSTNNKV